MTDTRPAPADEEPATVVAARQLADEARERRQLPPRRPAPVTRQGRGRPRVPQVPPGSEVLPQAAAGTARAVAATTSSQGVARSPKMAVVADASVT
ncbi:hypothetical protein SAMN06893096_10150 [Geodermatophilus pulveris]|uniref:Uncharacterized protein n=1 Tax=Geodermatophilus pulveris TaxID=1564159 RepID=A0A239AKA1_9ACTN|nr:hypothetical protein SAMN06893096_10150 [Geodermatophilus pulveris]